MPNAWKGKIQSISQEGFGIGNIIIEENGKKVRRPIFVPFTVPGDEIEAEIVQQKRKYTFGTLKEIAAASPLRVIPECPHFTVCGGCNLQHVAYDEQLRQKQQQIQFLLSRKNVNVPEFKILPAKQRHNYRWRAKIAVEFGGGSVKAGFRKFHSHDVIAVQTCYIVAPEIVQLIHLLNTSSAMLPSFVQEIIVVVGDNKKLGILVSLDETPQETRKEVKTFFDAIYAKNRKLIGNLFFEENKTTKTNGQVQEHITYKAAGLKFSFLPETFIQSNVPTNELLISTALEFLGNSKDSIVIDLYAGLGNISLPIAKAAKHVVAVEGHEQSVLLGRINAYQNDIENISFVNRSTERYISEYVKHFRANEHTEEYPCAQKIIIDPPRTGCTPPVIAGLLNSGAQKILYISCNPVTLANDLSMLSAKYDVKRITGIDMFPDISHVETLVLLELRQ